MILRTLAIASLALALTGCPSQEKSTVPATNPAATPPASAATSAASQADPRAVVPGNNAFALDFFKAIAASSAATDNLFVSPHSISTALAMTWGGARGTTEEEMARVLRFTGDQTATHAGFQALESSLNGVGAKRPWTLSVANRLWGAEDQKFEAPFLALTRGSYNAPLQQLPFATDPDRSRTEINTWVERQTADKIKDLLQPGDIDRDTRLVLTNAIYFKGAWKTKFDPNATRSGEFSAVDGSSVPVPFMNLKLDVPFLADDTTLAVELPYQGDRLAMLLLMPRDETAFATWSTGLDATRIDAIVAGLGETEVSVTIPRFKMTSRAELSPILSGMGMPSAFGTGADFSGMTGDRSLAISAVIHQAFVDVNEEGTEAAAATAVIMKRLSVGPTFIADRPFIFAIRDRETRAILFLGRMVKPDAPAGA